MAFTVHVPVPLIIVTSEPTLEQAPLAEITAVVVAFVVEATVKPEL
jgi:hypothetical protein